MRAAHPTLSQKVRNLLPLAGGGENLLFAKLSYLNISRFVNIDDGGAGKGKLALASGEGRERWLISGCRWWKWAKRPGGLPPPWRGSPRKPRTGRSLRWPAP